MKSQEAGQQSCMHELRQVEATMRSQVRDIIEAKRATTISPEDFKLVLDIVTRYQMVSPQMIAEQFDLSCSTISRWKKMEDGTTPHRVFRKEIFEWLSEVLSDVDGGDEKLMVAGDLSSHHRH